MRDILLLLKWLLVAGLLAVGARWSFGLASPSSLPLPRGIVHDVPSVRDLETRQFPEHPWALLLGGSSINEAIDRQRLRRPSRKQAIIYGQATDSAFALDWTLTMAGDEHKPEIVVWGVNPICFIRRPGYPVLASKVVQDRFNPRLFGRLGLAAAEYQPPTGERLSYAWSRFDRWYRQRAVLHEALQRSLAGWVDGVPALPSGQPESLSHFDTNDQRHRRKVIGAYRRMGLFDEKPFQPWHLAALEFIIERCREAGVPLLVIGIPEHSEMRKEYPPGAYEAFLDRFRGLGADIVDWSTMVPDELFDDHIHQGEQARIQFTARLSAELDSRVGPSPHRSKLAE